MDDVEVDAGGLAPISITGKKKRITRVVPVGNVIVGSLGSVRDLVECKMVVPNFAGAAKVAGSGVQITLEEISTETTHQLSVAESQGKVLPSSYLKVLRLREDAGETTELAVNDFGWLLSFYAGRRIHPVAWEGKTEYGTVWRIHNWQLITPLSDDQTDSCISDVVTPGHFLQHAWSAWQSHDEQHRTRIRGAVNFYADLLSTTFSTQRLALTTMYLERFRDLMLGSSTLLEAINKDQKKVNVDKVAKKVRMTLRDATKQSEVLSAEEEQGLDAAIDKVGAGQIHGLFRKTFKESLLELYEKANLEIDSEELGRFIRERNRVVHGSWDSGLEGTMRTYRLAEYGLNLLEMLLLRLFEYQGRYHDRASASREEFPSGTAN